MNGHPIEEPHCYISALSLDMGPDISPKMELWVQEEPPGDSGGWSRSQGFLGCDYYLHQELLREPGGPSFEEVFYSVCTAIFAVLEVLLHVEEDSRPDR